MKLLILGGGVFLGAAVLQAARARGDAVSVFTRGRACSVWPQGVEALYGDRDGDLSAIDGRRWDAVIDTSGYLPAQLHASTAALRDCDRYLFVSSVSAYASFAHAPVREADPLASSTHIEPGDRSGEAYGAQKAACERVLQTRFDARALIVRPGLIVGPGDRTGRFSHWPWRCADGGEMLVPDVPAPARLQVIDVRDLAAWLLVLLDAQAEGVFNATGPLDATGCDWPTLMSTCAAVVEASGRQPAVPVAVSEAFLAEHRVEPWSDLPLWLPSSDAAYAGFMQIDLERARAAGLRTRPLAQTLDAILEEGVPSPGEPRRRGALDPKREAELIAAWRAA